jgi:hypothetical protein
MTPEQPAPPELDHIEQCFWKFHLRHPRVYEELRNHAINLKRRGRKHYGVKALFEVIRYHRALETDEPGKQWLLNNNYSALYARLLMKNEPELRGFFRLRARHPQPR